METNSLTDGNLLTILIPAILKPAIFNSTILNYALEFSPVSSISYVTHSIPSN